MRAFSFFLILTISHAVWAQSAFDKYGIYGAEVYKTLETAIGMEKGVYKLDLSYQRIDPKLFPKISKLSNLQVLRFTSNNIDHWPEDFSKLNNLVYIASVDNAFTGFPHDLKKLSNLMHLELFGTKIDSLPLELAYLQHLKTFRFSNNNDTLKITPHLKSLKALHELSIENALLDSCPYPLFRIPSLNFLSLSNCNIQAMPGSTDKMHNLEVLILDGNKIQELPREIYACNKLIHLSLKNNKLSKIPDTICHLKKLSHLDLRGNPLSHEDVEEVKALLPGCKVLF